MMPDKYTFTKWKKKKKKNTNVNRRLYSETYLGLYRISMMKFLEKIVNGL